MPPRGKERTTRNSSQTRVTGRESQTADSHAAEGGTSSQELLSQASDMELPAGKQNKPHTDKTNEQVGVLEGNTEKKNNGTGNKMVSNNELITGPSTESISGDLNPSSPAHPLTPMSKEGDNRDSQHSPERTAQEKTNREQKEGFTGKSKPGDPWHEAFLELQANSVELRYIRTRMEKLDSIEEATSTLTTKLSTIAGKTAKLESQVEGNTSQVRDLKEEISILKDRAAKQDQKIQELLNIKEDYKKATRKSIGEMNDLVKAHKDQVDSFNEVSERMKNDIMDRVDTKVDGLSKDLSHTKLKSQAHRNKQNLVITGLEEDVNKSPKKEAAEFIESSLKIKDVDIDVAYRMGTPPAEGSSYCRPLVVKFARMEDRNKVWKKRVDITAEKDDHKIRVQADLPKKLREEVKVLYRVAKAAAASHNYKSAILRDYSILWKDKEYAPSQLESLPRPIRPSTLATRSSDKALVFFSRHSVLSNHHPSTFKLRGTTYHNVEQYLAHKRAILSGQDSLIQKALRAKIPAVAKSILNSLREDHTEEWENNIETWATESVRAKFNQNETLANFLCNTGKLHLGEASRNGRWGVGMDLDNPDVLDFHNWPAESNLLGKTLMKIREEIQLAREQPRAN